MQQSNYDNWVRLSKQLTDQKRYAEAERAMQQAVTISGHDEWTWRHLSWLQHEQGKFDDALQNAKRAISIQETPLGFLDLAKAAWGAHEFAQGAQAATYAVGFGRAACGGAYDGLVSLRDRCSPKEYILTDMVQPKKAKLVLGSKVRRALRVAQDAPPYQSTSIALTGAQEFALRTQGELKWVEVLPAGESLFSIITTIRLSPYSFKDTVKRFRPDVPLPTDVKPYLGDTGSITLGPKVRELAPTLRGQDDLATVTNIQQWFLRRFKYAGDGGGSVEEILTRCTGHCDSIARLCSALCRVNGIAARPVRMNWGGDKQNVQAMWHSVVEVYVRGGGWVSLDPHNGGFGFFPLVYWPNSALRLHPYLAPEDNATWVEHARPTDQIVPKYTFRFQ